MVWNFMISQKNNERVHDHCHYAVQYKPAVYSNCNLTYQIPIEILVGFHIGSKHDYHFKIKQMTQKSEEKFEYLGDKTEKNITYSVPIEKSENGKIIKCKKNSLRV